MTVASIPACQRGAHRFKFRLGRFFWLHHGCGAQPIQQKYVLKNFVGDKLTAKYATSAIECHWARKNMGLTLAYGNYRPYS